MIGGEDSIIPQLWQSLSTPSVPYSVALDFETVERTGGAIDRIIEVMRYVTSDIILARTDLFSYPVQHFDSSGIELPGLALAINGNMRFNVPAIGDENIRKISEILTIIKKFQFMCNC